MDTCSEAGCEKPVSRRGVCDMHYMRWYRHGGTEPPSKKVFRRPLGHRYQRADGYIEVKIAPRRRVLEHRLVAEQMLGRPLAAQEHVHHLNGEKADNRPDNLVVMSNADHQKLHDWHITRFHGVELTCQACGRRYFRKRSKAASRFCSNACRMSALWEARRRQAAGARPT